MKLIIHIGMPKTGTTAIQYMLRDNTELLASHGILYPLISGTGHAHTHLCLLHHNPPPDFLRHHYRDDLRDHEQIGKDILAALVEKVEARSDNIHTVVISSEIWFTLPTFSNNAIFRAFIDRFDDVTVMCYVRRPSAFYVSALQQGLKADRSVPLTQPRYKTVFERLEAYPLQVRNFSRDALEDGDAVTDFARYVLGISLPEGIVRPRANESYSSAGMYLLHEWRAKLPTTYRGVRDRYTRTFETALWEAECALGNIDRPRLASGVAAWLDRPTDDLRYLRDRFGINLVPERTEPSAGPPHAAITSLEEIVMMDWERVEQLRTRLPCKFGLCQQKAAKHHVTQEPKAD